MRSQRKHIRGLLLGLAVGDAMGCTVDRRSWAQIQEDYGPGGLQGYDLVNGYAEISSYTQLAAFACNGLLLAMTRGQMRGKMAPLVNYIGLSSREWADVMTEIVTLMDARYRQLEAERWTAIRLR